MAKRKREDAEEVTQSTSVSRIKANLRQAKRLLAHDDVKLELRTTTERRIEALETQLAIAEARKKESELEQRLAVQYHGVKHIERKKTLRKINQLKTQLAALSEDDDSRQAIASALKRHRIDLHYINNYPSDVRYIALYPDGVYVEHDAPLSADKDVAKTDGDRATMRKDVRKRMKKGDLVGEPELVVRQQNDADQPRPAKHSRPTSKQRERKRTDHAPKASQAKAVSRAPAAPPAEKGLADDDFFDL